MILDIETTGLSPKYTEAILVGIIYNQNKQWHLTQLFCEHRSEEKKMLLALQKYIQHKHLIITYNGHAFDIPYLNKRYEHHKIDFKLNPSMNFDLYRVIRASKKALNLPNYKLKTIEEYLNIYRTDDISGKESVELYNQYEISPTEKLRDKILLHNYDDILFMIPTLEILNHIPEEIIDRYYPYVFKSKSFSNLVVTSFTLEHHYVSIEYESDIPLSPVMSFFDGFSLEIIRNSVKLTLPLFKVGNRQFIDIDQLEFINSSFNDLSIENQLSLEITTKKNALLASLKILEAHSL